MSHKLARILMFLSSITWRLKTWTVPVFRLLASLYAPVAAGFGIHERTAKFHRGNLTSHLGVHSAADFPRRAQQAEPT